MSKINNLQDLGTERETTEVNFLQLPDGTRVSFNDKNAIQNFTSTLPAIIDPLDLNLKDGFYNIVSRDVAMQQGVPEEHIPVLTASAIVQVITGKKTNGNNPKNRIVRFYRTSTQQVFEIMFNEYRTHSTVANRFENDYWWGNHGTPLGWSRWYQTQGLSAWLTIENIPPNGLQSIIDGRLLSAGVEHLTIRLLEGRHDEVIIVNHQGRGRLLIEPQNHDINSPYQIQFRGIRVSSFSGGRINIRGIGFSNDQGILAEVTSSGANVLFQNCAFGWSPNGQWRNLDGSLPNGFTVTTNNLIGLDLINLDEGDVIVEDMFAYDLNIGVRVTTGNLVWVNGHRQNIFGTQTGLIHYNGGTVDFRAMSFDFSQIFYDRNPKASFTYGIADSPQQSLTVGNHFHSNTARNTSNTGSDVGFTVRMEDLQDFINNQLPKDSTRAFNIRVLPGTLNGDLIISNIKNLGRIRIEAINDNERPIVNISSTHTITGILRVSTVECVQGLRITGFNILNSNNNTAGVVIYNSSKITLSFNRVVRNGVTTGNGISVTADSHSVDISGNLINNYTNAIFFTHRSTGTVGVNNNTNDVLLRIFSSISSVMAIAGNAFPANWTWGTEMGGQITLAGFQISSSVPMANNAQDLGTANLRYRTIFLQNAPSVVSDKNLKEITGPLIEEAPKYMQLLDELQAKRYKYKEIEGETPDLQVHIGFIAQEVKEAIQKVGLDHEALALFNVYDLTEWQDSGEVEQVFDYTETVDDTEIWEEVPTGMWVDTKGNTHRELDFEDPTHTEWTQEMRKVYGVKEVNHYRDQPIYKEVKVGEIYMLKYEEFVPILTLGYQALSTKIDAIMEALPNTQQTRVVEAIAQTAFADIVDK